MLLGDLVDRHAPVGELSRLLASDAAEEGVDPVVATLDAWVFQLGEDRHLPLPALQGLEQRGQLQVRALARREERFRAHSEVHPDAHESSGGLGGVGALERQAGEPGEGQRGAADGLEEVPAMHERGFHFKIFGGEWGGSDFSRAGSTLFCGHGSRSERRPRNGR